MKPKVVVIGIGFSTRLGIIRSIADDADDISIIMIENEKEKPLDSYSKYVNNCYCSGNNERKLIQIIKEKCTDEKQKVILIPTNDFSASALDNNYDLLKDYFYLPHIHFEQGAIAKWMNKDRQKELAKEVELAVAYSNNVEIVEGHFNLPENINYPCFTKTRECNIKGYKHTLHRCNDEQELCSFLGYLGRKFHNITVMVEDYMEIKKEYAVVGFSDGKEVVIPGVIEILAMTKGLYRGIACQGMIMPVNGFELLVEKFKKMIFQMGFVGLFDIDFYLSNGIFYFGEVNLRMGGSGYAVTKMGVNLPRMLVNHFMGVSIDGMKKQIDSVATFVNERMCLDNWYGNYISTKEFYKLVKESDISFVKDERDQLPERMFRKELNIKRIKRFIKNCLRR